MIISRGRKYIFVHAPKTGGTSLMLALEDRAKKDDILIGDTPKARRRRGRLKDLPARGRLWKHSRLDDIEGILDPETFPDFFILTLVRNPWDRVVSYYHWLAAQDFDHPAVRTAKSHEFDQFLNDPQVQMSLKTHPYSRYVTGSDGREHCNLFARLEHLQDDLQPFRDHLGFDPGPIPLTNTSGRDRNYRPYFTGATADLVGQICAEDIARFDYAF